MVTAGGLVFDGMVSTDLLRLATSYGDITLSAPRRLGALEDVLFAAMRESAFVKALTGYKGGTRATKASKLAEKRKRREGAVIQPPTIVPAGHGHGPSYFRHTPFVNLVGWAA
jgi:hypothetical protein